MKPRVQAHLLAVIRLFSRGGAFDSHVCRGALPTADKRAPQFRSIRKNGNLSDIALSGAAVHAAVRRRDIESAELFMCPSYRFLDGIELSHVTFQRQGLISGECLRNLLCCIEINVRKYHSGTALGQYCCGRCTQSTTGSGDQDDFVGSG